MPYVEVVKGKEWYSGELALKARALKILSKQIDRDLYKFTTNSVIRMDARRYDKVITIHQLHSLSIEEIHQNSLMSFLRASIRHVLKCDLGYA